MTRVAIPELRPDVDADEEHREACRALRQALDALMGRVETPRQAHELSEIFADYYARARARAGAAASN